MLLLDSFTFAKRMPSVYAFCADRNAPVWKPLQTNPFTYNIIISIICTMLRISLYGSRAIVVLYIAYVRGRVCVCVCLVDDNFLLGLVLLGSFTFTARVCQIHAASRRGTGRNR